MTDGDHPLRRLLDDAARGVFPAADGAVELLPAPPGPAMAVVGFTAHFAVATDAPADWVRARLPPGDLLAPLRPRFLADLERLLGRNGDGVDVLLAGPGLDGSAALEEVDRADHPRVRRAVAHREDVRVFEDRTRAAVVILGGGLAGRAEVAIEVDEDARNRGAATAALVEARKLISPGDHLFAQTAPGNAASLRALLAAGFRPIGSEVLFFSRGGG